MRRRLSLRGSRKTDKLRGAPSNRGRVSARDCLTPLEDARGRELRPRHDPQRGGTSGDQALGVFLPSTAPAGIRHESGPTTRTLVIEPLSASAEFGGLRYRSGVSAGDECQRPRLDRCQGRVMVRGAQQFLLGQYLGRPRQVAIACGLINGWIHRTGRWPEPTELLPSSPRRPAASPPGCATAA